MIEVILVGCDRPKMIQRALSSIPCECSVSFIDDSSKESIPLPSLSWRGFRRWKVGDSIEQKVRQGGSRHGQYINEAIETSTEEIVVILCDDDALVPGSIPLLTQYYIDNPDVVWSYSHVLEYDPLRPFDSVTSHTKYNVFRDPIFPSCRVDSSQVTYRRSAFLAYSQLRYDYPQTRNLDAKFFSKMASLYGLCPFNGVVLQYKAVFRDQLGNRNNDFSVKEE